ncbi:endonuclease/exonuclease/phosphatase family protein [Flavobacteriales bacterium]|nr:endonuclease/exonuclease/phosphatase family protein [Flavobacteriales bacterium]
MALGKGRSGKGPKSKRGKLAMMVGWLGTLSVLAAWAATVISPATTTLPALAGLFFPIGAVMWGMGWITAARSWRLKSLLVMTLAGALCAPLFRATWGCGGCGSPEGTGEVLTVVSWNVRLFDFYGWLDNSENGGPENSTKNRIMEAIASAGPDVLCLQEYFELDPERSFPVVSPLDGAVGDGAQHHVVISRRKGPRSFGVATWSKWPIVRRSSIDFGTRKNNVCAVTDVVWEGDTVRIFNAHFSSLRFEEEDYAALEDGVPNAAGRERIWGRMRSAYVERVAQVKAVMEAVQVSPHPVVLCGDFNDTPTSWSLAHCRAELKDSHDVRWFSMDGTWQGAVPGVRIDHIFMGKEWAGKSYTTGGVGLSDHRFVRAELQVARR